MLERRCYERRWLAAATAAPSYAAMPLRDDEHDIGDALLALYYDASDDDATMPYDR